jgi:mannose-6-phosphate isomerase-like protein (cupin superfamily)
MPEDLRHTVVRLDEVESIAVAGVNWMPLRRALGATGFGIAAFTAGPGEQLIEPHDETSGGAHRHEEVYAVIAGRARFTLGDEQLDAPAGTLVLVPVGLFRSATAEEPGTTVLAVGGPPGTALPPAAFEYWFMAEPAYRAGAYERAIEIASEGLADYPEHPSLRYQLACFCSLAGRADEAIEHLRAAFAGNPKTREWAANDSDLDPIRDRPDYPSSGRRDA